MMQIIIYGIGKIGKKYVDRCLDCGIKNIKIVDSDEKLWGGIYRNIEILSPDDAFEMEYDMVIISAACRYRKEILEKLENIYKVPHEKIAYSTETLVSDGNEIYNIGDMELNEKIPLGIITVKELYSQLQKGRINNLEKFFFEGEHGILDKWLHYFEAYERMFKKYRTRNVTILEIGVSKGGSLQMWKDYFQNANNTVMVYGIDINPDCKKLEEENVRIFIGSQEDRAFLKGIKKEIHKVDILIDDGGHTMDQQIISFEELFDLVRDDGIYLCEDTHTSYMKQFGGQYKGDTFIEYSKNLIDYLHAQYSETETLISNKYSEEIKSITYYDSMVFIEKKKKTTKSVNIQCQW